MWEPQRLTILWVSTACNRDIFAFFICLHHVKWWGTIEKNWDRPIMSVLLWDSIKQRTPGMRGMRSSAEFGFGLYHYQDFIYEIVSHCIYITRYSSHTKKPRRGINKQSRHTNSTAKPRNETRLTCLSIIGILATTLWQELTSLQPNIIGSTLYVVESWIGCKLANSVVAHDNVHCTLSLTLGWTRT
jgi:hypothetical protein